jgi:O-antigen ligase
VGVAFAFFYYINLQHKKIWNSHALIKYIFLIGLLFLLLFSNSRGGIVYVGISLLLMLKLKKMLQLALLLSFFIVLFYDLIEPYVVMLSSIFDLASNAAGGSSFVMRSQQFSSVIEILEGSPWFGYGPRTFLYWQAQRPDLVLFGFESIWLQLFIKQGIVGIAAHIYLIYSMLKLGIGKSKRYVIGTVAGFIVVTTATVGLSIEFFMGLLLVVYRLELWSVSEQNKCQ